MLDGNLPSNDLINYSSYSYCRAITSETGRRTSVRLWPRLCENGALIIMQRSQYQGQMNEAIH